MVSFLKVHKKNIFTPIFTLIFWDCLFIEGAQRDLMNLLSLPQFSVIVSLLKVPKKTLNLQFLPQFSVIVSSRHPHQQDGRNPGGKPSAAKAHTASGSVRHHHHHHRHPENDNIPHREQHHRQRETTTKNRVRFNWISRYTKEFAQISIFLWFLLWFSIYFTNQVLSSHSMS